MQQINAVDGRTVQQRPDWVYEVMQEERRLVGADLDGAEGGKDHARSHSEA